MRARPDIGISNAVAAGQLTVAAFILNPKTPEMKMTRLPSRVRISRALPILSASILAALFPSADAAVFTWDNTTNNWSDPARWGGVAPATSDPTVDLIFGGAAGPYTANNDIANFFLNTLTLNATVAEIISGFSLDFRTDGADAATITQSGLGAFTIGNGIVLTNPLTLGAAAGAGTTTLTGVVSGGGLLSVGSGNWVLSNTANSWSGGTTITGGVLELAPAAGTSVSIPAAVNSPLGNTGAVTINGGELKITTSGAGVIEATNNVSRPITFGTAGGTLNLNGQISANTGATFSLALPAAPGAPSGTAVVKFNGGAQGTSNAGGTDWVIGGNTLRIASLTNQNVNNPVRIELSNGAMLHFNGTFANVTSPVTLRGPAGGDPTATSPDKSVGRVQADGGPYVFNNGLFIDGTMQISTAGGFRSIDGNITVNPNANAVFAGRGTGTVLDATDSSRLQLGTVANGKMLTISNGATATADLRIRYESANQFGVQILETMNVLAGGTLKATQSWMGASPTGTDKVVGWGHFDGNIVGNGTTASESVFDLRLGVANTVAPFNNQNGITFSGNIVVNGSGFGGLRVSTAGRVTRSTATPLGSTYLFSADGSTDPIASDTKINNYLTPARLAAITGSGGYLTPAPAGKTFAFPAGGEWANAVTVGLRTVHQNTISGADVSIAALAQFTHNVVVDSGATLDTGAGNVTLGPAVATPGLGLIGGTGTISGAGGITINTGATLAPGFSIGTLTVGNITLNGTFQYEATNTPASDLLVVGGNLTLGGASKLSLPGGNTYATADYTLATYTGTLTGTFGTVPALPAGFVLSYGTGTNSAIKLTYSTPTDTWDGTVSGFWNTTAANWKTLAAFANLHKVIIDDNAAGPNTNIVINAGDVTPFSIVVNNGTLIANYSITGSAGNAIIGTGSLTKNGTGTLTLSGPHSYSGGTTVMLGTLRLGASDSLPNVGAITVATGAVLDVNGMTDTIATLSVDGSVTAGNLTTTGAVALGDGASVAANLTLGGDVTKTGAVGTTVSGTINLGGTRIFTVAPNAAPELTLGGAVSNGALTKNGNGTLVLNNGGNSYAGATTVNGGTLKVGVAGALPANTALTISAGAVDGNDTALSVSSLTGAGGAALTLGSGSLAIAQAVNTVFSGDITGTGGIVKTLGGRLTLNGAGSNYSGGLMVSGGTVIAASVSAAGTVAGPGTGIVTVNVGATFQVGANLTVPIVLNGGRLASQGNPGQLTNNDLTAADGTTSTVLIADSTNLAANSEAILLGTLRGGGNINIAAGTANGAPDGGPGFRLRGGAASDFGGVITAGQSTKFEVQIAGGASPNPLGAGKVVLTGGTRLGNLNGTYSQFQTRITGAGETVVFGNNIEIAGAGYVNYNALGGVNVTANFGDLKIGGGQIFGFNKNDVNNRTVIFDSVTLTGGNAEFRLFDPGFTNSATPGGANLKLGVIGGVAGSGVIFLGQAPYITTITGDSNYSGTTTVSTGTLQVGEGGATGTLGAGAVTDNALIVFNRSDNLAVPNSITGTGTVTNSGGAANVLDLIGAQDYATLNANSGDTHLHGAFANGTATVNVLAKLGIAVSQTIGALNISDGATVTFDSALPSLPAPPAADGGIADFGNSSGDVQPVPEPGAMSLLLLGALGWLRRRARN